MKTKSIILIILILITASNLNSQIVVANNSSNFANFLKLKKRKPIKTEMKKGDTKELKFFLFEDYRYTFSLKTSNHLKNVNFRLINKDNKVIFDNAVSNLCNSVIIYIDKTQRIRMIITTQPPNFKEKNNKYYKLKININKAKRNNAK